MGYRRPTLSAQSSILGARGEPDKRQVTRMLSAPVASYAGAPSRGDTLRAMSSRVAKVFRS
jgi:hypothetical protein